MSFVLAHERSITVLTAGNGGFVSFSLNLLTKRDHSQRHKGVKMSAPFSFFENFEFENEPPKHYKALEFSLKYLTGCFFS